MHKNLWVWVALMTACTTEPVRVVVHTRHHYHTTTRIEEPVVIALPIPEFPTPAPTPPAAPIPTPEPAPTAPNNASNFKQKSTIYHAPFVDEKSGKPEDK